MKSWLITPLLLAVLSGTAACNQQSVENIESSTETIKIGAAVSDTGKYAREGKDTRQGYDLWEDWINERGGIELGDRKYQVEI